MISVAQTVGGLAVFAGLYLVVQRLVRSLMRQHPGRGNSLSGDTGDIGSFSTSSDSSFCGDGDGADGGSCDGGGDGGGDSGD